MIVKVSKRSGFCPGVKAAEKKIFAQNGKKNHPPIYVLGMMINNHNYIEYLGQKGIMTIDDHTDMEDGSTVAIRTHGINRHLEKKLSERLELVDLTCINVKKVQLRIKEESEGGAFTVITGKKSHPEVLGLESYAENSFVIENEKDINEFKKSRRKLSRIFITSQTTGSRMLFDKTVMEITAAWPEADISVFNSICPVTDKKEKEALLLQKDADISFVVGDPLSSNANKLYDILKNGNEKTFFIRNLGDLKSLKEEFGLYSSALVVSSSSTPDFIENEIVEYLKSL